MSCSFCHFAGHNVTTCQSTVLLRLVDQIMASVKTMKAEPLTNTHSKAMTLHTDIGSRSLDQLKGIASKLNIKITGKNKRILTALVVKKLWFGDEFDASNPSVLVSDINYYIYLNHTISGVSEWESWREYINITRTDAPRIHQQMRIYNLERLETVKNVCERLYNHNRDAFYLLADTLERDENYRLRIVGSYVTLDDICQNIPILAIWFRPLDEIIDFEDVIHEQKLDLICAYDEELEKTEEECSICFSDSKCDTMLDCEHMFCIDCVTTTVKMVVNDHRKKLTCAMCRAETKCIISVDEVKIKNLASLL